MPMPKQCGNTITWTDPPTLYCVRIANHKGNHRNNTGRFEWNNKGRVVRESESHGKTARVRPIVRAAIRRYLDAERTVDLMTDAVLADLGNLMLKQDGEAVPVYARFTMDGTYDGDAMMRCMECAVVVDRWPWHNPHTLVDYLASAEAHNADRHGHEATND